MTSKVMSATQIARFVSICENQGIKITRTKKGLLIRFPDGSSTVQHFTNSDVRATQNQIARFRRSGVVHPDDSKPLTELPAYITDNPNVTPRTRQKIKDYLLAQESPTTVNSGSIHRKMGLDPTTVNRALYAMGFKPGVMANTRSGRPWTTPAELLEELAALPKPEPKPKPARKPIPVNDPVIDEALRAPAGTAEEAEHQLNEAMRKHDQLKSQELVDVIDFIDDRDSWTADLSKVPHEVYTYLRGLEAVGLKAEIRVWRA